MDILQIIDPQFRYYETNKEIEKKLCLKRNIDDKSSIRYISDDDTQYIHIVRLPHKKEHHSFVKLNLQNVKDAKGKDLTFIFLFDDETENIYEWKYKTKEIALAYSFNNDIRTEPYIQVFTKYFEIYMMTEL